jgi:hypothetical protein
VNGGFNLFLEAVIQIVMDLQNKILIVEEFRQVTCARGLRECKYRNRIEGLAGLTLSSRDIHMPESDG